MSHSGWSEEGLVVWLVAYLCMFMFSKWYYNSSINDLDYWGLDYPPLTAMHSYAMGKAFQKVLPDAVKLKTSRGYESPKLKFLMRLTVLLSDILIPALILFHSKFTTEDKRLTPLACSKFLII